MRSVNPGEMSQLDHGNTAKCFLGCQDTKQDGMSEPNVKICDVFETFFRIEERSLQEDPRLDEIDPEFRMLKSVIGTLGICPEY